MVRKFSVVVLRLFAVVLMLYLFSRKGLEVVQVMRVLDTLFFYLIQDKTFVLVVFSRVRISVPSRGGHVHNGMCLASARELTEIH